MSQVHLDEFENSLFFRIGINNRLPETISGSLLFILRCFSP